MLPFKCAFYIPYKYVKQSMPNAPDLPNCPCPLASLLFPIDAYTNTHRNLRQQQPLCRSTEIIPFFTGTSTVEMTLFILWTPNVGCMSISYIIEPVDLRTGEKEGRSDTMNRCIPPSFIKEST